MAKKQPNKPNRIMQVSTLDICYLMNLVNTDIDRLRGSGERALIARAHTVLRELQRVTRAEPGKPKPREKHAPGAAEIA
jgi:hypothetical protein